MTSVLVLASLCMGDLQDSVNTCYENFLYLGYSNKDKWLVSEVHVACKGEEVGGICSCKSKETNVTM